MKAQDFGLLLMFLGRFGVDEEVIEIHHEELIEEVGKSIVHVMLECTRGVA